MESIVSITVPDEIAEFCDRWKIAELALFGSALRQDFGVSSDIDLLATFQEDAQWSLLDHIQMEHELETLFGRHVDLISRRAVQRSPNWIRRGEILSTAQVIFSAHEGLLA